MIRRIEIKEKSYKEKLELDVDKKFNFFYGLNGSGKTVLSNFLKNYKDNMENIKGLDNNNKILVYNQKFINENFYEKDNLRGIFTLSSENIEVEKNIENLTKSREKEDEKLTEQKKEEELLVKQKIDLENKIKDNLWKIKQNYEKTELSYCLDKYKGSKDTLFSYIIKLEKLDNFDKTVEILEKEFKNITDNNLSNISDINLIDIDLNSEKNDIFKKIIVGNINSTLSSTIEKLNNSDWVKEGYNKYINNSKKCPFCQNETITVDFLSRLKDYFNKDYDNDIAILNEIYSKYKEIIENIPSKEIMLDNYFIKEEKNRFENLYEKLINNINNNIQNIEIKIKEPSKKVNIFSSESFLNNLNNFLKEIQDKIKKCKEELSNKEDTRKKIKDDFWQIMRNKYDMDILEYKNKEKDISENIEKTRANITNTKTQINTINKQIQDEQSKTINIEKAIQNINKNLNELGIIDFKIEKYDENFYKIARIDTIVEEPVFKTLSEGEKTIITFLYFVELCIGKEIKDEIDKKKIVVIDDPVSSLSHNYLFDVAQLIKLNFLEDRNKNLLQVFILTHNLYFFHEILNIFYRHNSKDYNLFRIYKDKNKCSKIDKIEKQDIKNEYEAYWQIIKDFNKNNLYNPMIPNTMRNILEHYISFVCVKDYDKYINELACEKYKNNAFIRYIKRESHSDSKNSVFDTKEFENASVMEIFKNIFEKIGHIEHYNRMMDIKTGATDE